MDRRTAPLAVLWRRPMAVAVAATLPYAAVAACFRAFTWPMRVAIAVPIAVTAVTALRLGWHRPGPVRPEEPRRERPAPLDVLGTSVWMVLIAGSVAFQLAMFLSQPRQRYPTLSSLAGDAFEWAPARAAAIWMWLLLGVSLLRRR